MVSVELQKVVSGGNKAPFRAGGRPASSFEAVDPPVCLDLGKDGFDHPFSLRVELAAGFCGEDSSHEVVGDAAAGRSRFVAV